MSGPVDVLAVLDAASATFDNIRFERRHESTELQIEFWSRRIAEVIAARAAVAELIAAAKMANGDHSAPYDCYATGPLTGDPVMDLVVCPGCRLAAALARCGSTK